MKLLAIVFLAVLALCATEPQEKKKTAPPKELKPLVIPAGAVEREPGTFYYTDKQGKKWIYRKTPFGIARYDEKALEPDPRLPKPVDESAYWKVTEQGDIVKFERPGPFGVYKWEKKKSELDEKERAALKKAQDSSQQEK
jgi:hypothetical protein